MYSTIRFALLLVICFATTQVIAQSINYLPVFSSSNQTLPDSVAQVVDEYVTLTPNEALWQKILETKPAQLHIALPAPDGSTWNLTLNAYAAVSKGFRVTALNASGQKETVDVFTGLHYSGAFDDGRKGLIALSILDDEWMGVISFGTGNYVLGRLGTSGKTHVLYNDATLKAFSPFVCGTTEPENFTINQAPVEAGNRGGGSTGCVNVYVEASYRLYQNKSSNLNTTTQWVTGLFNVISQVYANDQISVRMSELFVRTSIDPYYSFDLAEDVLYGFGNDNSNFNGDLAHHLTIGAGWSDAAGIAFLDGLCNGYGYGTSNVPSNYNSLPTYSWAVNVVTHELGHNLGSPHTHSCSWQGGPIDTCYAVEGNCYNGPERARIGTVMSYCHTNGSVNLNLGFGPRPRNLIQNNISNNSFCLEQVSGPTSITSASGNTTVCPGGNIVLTVNGGSLGTGGQWVWYEGSCGTSVAGTGRTITLSPTATTQYFARGEGCQNTNCISVTVTVSAASVLPTAISAVSNILCSGTNTQLNLVGGQLSAGAQWEWYSDICGLNSVGLGNSVTVAPTATTTYFVRASGDCSVNGNCISIPITVINTPNVVFSPADTTVLPGRCVTITATGGDTYTWYDGSTTPSIEVCEPAVGVYNYNVIVSNNGDCGVSKNAKVTFAEPSNINTIADKAWGIYPNPNTGTFTISFNQPHELAAVVLMDMLGRVVHQQVYPVLGSQVQIDAQLPNGMYVVKVETGGQVAFKKILVAE